ncbi:prostate androgen-regulated mucin-like protein 1 [Rhinolophus ferrumequinum]|uniref:Prostate androgen-regulated mucin-like protein 1 n=1 Tax=Rhinolophus ferrumequinum TaxID=59479 RepID=A0A671FYY5_RHIFE|nr:prostate androgen-regulated mucin-like protein 1 [Rhinolophus ferrumequinum]KAF6372264.1 prostate androgen-regulated mucin-like protein 1 [Rhinolophus ferrumequinum]
MVCKILFVLCIFTAGLRVQSVPTVALLPVSHPAKITPTTAIWTSSPQGSPASTTSTETPSNSVLPVTVSSPVQTSLLPKNVSLEPREQPREQDTTSPTLAAEGTNTDLLSTSGGIHLTPTPGEHSSGTSEASVPATGSQSPAESPALTSPQTPASSPSTLPTSPPEVPSTSISTNHSSAEPSTKPTGAATTPEAPAEEHSSGHTPTSHATSELVPMETTPQTTLPAKVTCILVDMETTTASPRVIMQEVEHALSPGSIAAITVTVIAVVLLVFGVAAYLKIRHSSYGRLLDDHDYGSWGNYNNPLYDDS